MFFSVQSGILTHLSEYGSVLFPELPRLSRFGHLSLLHDHNPIRLQDGVEPVGNGDDSAITEALPDGLLDGLVRVGVHGGGGLVQNKDLGLPQQCPRQAQQLPLTN